MRIYDLARRTIELSGFTLKNEVNPNGDIDIKITGLRPGEKLHEELLTGDDPSPTQYPRIMKAHETFIPWDQLKAQLISLSLVLSVNDVPIIRKYLLQMVTGHQPTEGVVDWVHLEQERQTRD